MFYFGTKAADADGDGDTDGNDYVVWQSNWPAASGHTWQTGDFEGNGDVSGGDFNIYFTSGGALSLITASADVLRTISYQYDAAGQLKTVTDPDAEYNYDYDDLGRVKEVSQQLAGLTPLVVFTQGFDAMGRRTSLNANIDSTDDFADTFLYDNLGRQTRVTQQGQGGGNTVAAKRVDLSYRADGSFDVLNRYANTAGTQLVATGTYGYDDNGRLTSLTYGKGMTAFAGYEWTWDAAGRITSFTNREHSGEDADYDYDDAGQLTDVDYDSLTDEGYNYDENGNRIDVDNDAGSATYTTDDNNQLTSDGTYNYQYDGEGNRVLRTNISTGYYTVYEWD